VHDRISVILPIAALVGVLAALMVFQRLQIVVVAQVHGGQGDVDGAALIGSFELGIERTFYQDPR
jgi:hypothetical protein